MTAAELIKLKWATTLLTCGRADDAREELVELIAAVELNAPELLATYAPGHVRLKAPAE